jgi:predicted TIM-barrel fold metal-dependent hydrolase
MKIIDFHTHIYPEHIAEKATKSICDFYNLSTGLIGTSKVLLEEGKKAGISNFVLLPVAIKPEHVHQINQFTVCETEAHPEFFGFGALHAYMADPLGEINFIELNGLKGVKLHPDAQKFPIDEERLFPVYDRLQGNLPVLMHCGDPRYDYSHPERLKRVLNLFPRLQIIAAHLGGWSMFDKAFEYLKNTGCFFDISSCMMYLSPKQMKEYITCYGADRILFGSDFPVWNPQNEVETFMRLDLTLEEKEKVAYKNASKILKITET